LPETSISYVETPDNEDINSLYVKYDQEAILQLIIERVFLFSTETSMIVPNTNRNENPGYANWSEANPIRSLKNKLFTDENKTVERPIEKEKQYHRRLTEQPVPSSLKLNIQNPGYITFESHGLQFVLLGGVNLSQMDRMRVTLKISRDPELNGYRIPGTTIC